MTNAINHQYPLECSFLDLPHEVTGRVINFCPTSTLGPMALTCQYLYNNVFFALAQGSFHRSALCSKIVQRCSQEALERFLASCKNAGEIIKIPVQICVTDQQMVPKSLEMIQSFFPIESLTLEGKNFGAQNVSDCLRACPTIKTLRFFNCHSINFGKISSELFQNIEKMVFSKVTFYNPQDEAQPISSIVNQCKNLKQITLLHCDNFDQDIYNYTIDNNLFEFFSENNWYDCDLEDGWEKEIGYWLAEDEEEKFRQTQDTNILSTYYFASNKLWGCSQPVGEHLLNIKTLLREAIQKAPQFVNPKITLARVLLGEEDFPLDPEKQKEAEQLLRESRNIVPSCAQASMLLGLLFLATKREEEGYAFLKMSLASIIQQRDIPSLFEIAKAIDKKYPNLCANIRDVVFWYLLGSPETRAEYKAEINNDILDIDKTHLLAILNFEEWPLTEGDEALEVLEGLESTYLERNDIPALLISAFCRKKSELLQPIKTAVLPKYFQPTEQALQKLMENFFDIPSWITLLQALHMSKISIIPCLSLLAFFTKTKKILKDDFSLVGSKFLKTHEEWLTKSLPAIVAYRK